MSSKFLVKLCLVTLPVLIVVVLWERELRKMPTSHTVKKAQLEKHLSDLEVLIVGTSHAHHGINPAYMKSKALNMANVSQSFYYDKELVLKYLPRLKKLKKVIIPISYFSLEYSMRDSSEYWRTFFYANNYNIPREDTPSYDFDIRSYSFIALYGRPTALLYAKSYYSEPLTHVEKTGWEALNGGGNCDYGVARAKYHTGIMRPSRVVYSMKQLTELLEGLKKYHVQAILITTPVCPNYAKSVDPKKYKIMQKSIATLRKKYKLPYYDFSVDKRFETKDFYDDHLTPEGAKKFSLILNDVINK